MIDKNKIEFFFFKNFVRLFNKLGLTRTRRFAKVIGLFIYYFIPIRKKTTLENLKKAFPDKAQSEIRAIAKRNYQNITITFFELMILPHLSVAEIIKQVKVENLEIITEKLQSGRGLILLTGHFGNWELIVPALSTRIDYKFNMLVKPQRNEYVTKWLDETRSLSKAEIIPTGAAALTIPALKNGEILLVVGDQRGNMEGPRFNFFNNATAFYIGTATIAEKTNANVIICITERLSDCSYKLHLEEINFKTELDNYESKIIDFTQRYINRLEKYVANSPEQFFWMHKIWKF
jgi:KDO2-lipid IV(A) lauroyltransferase